MLTSNKVSKDSTHGPLYCVASTRVHARSLSSVSLTCVAKCIDVGTNRGLYRLSFVRIIAVGENQGHGKPNWCRLATRQDGCCGCKKQFSYE